MRTLFMVLVLALASLAQTIVVGNMNEEEAQTRWVVVHMPKSQADALPDECLVNQRFPAVREESLGITSTNWCVKVEVPAGGELVLDDWQPLPAGYTIPDFELSERFLSEPERSVLRVMISEDEGSGFNWKRTLYAEGGTVVSQTKARLVMAYRKSKDGFHSFMWVSFYSGSDIAEAEGLVVWSSDEHNLMKYPNPCQVTLTSGRWPYNSPNNKRGDDLYMPLHKRRGAWGWKNNTWRLWRGEMVHGCYVDWEALLLPERNEGGILPITFDEQRAEKNSIEDDRDAAQDAARGGALVATAVWPDGEWLAFGKVVQTAQRTDAAAFSVYFNGNGKLYDQLPFGNDAGRHGTTGLQPDFAASQGHKALNGDWRHAFECEWSARDYFLRGFGHYFHDGTSLTKDDPRAIGVQTWASSIENRASPSTFGKDRSQPTGWAEIAGTGRNITANAQHRAGNYQVLGVVFGGFAQRELVERIVAHDELRAMPARGHYDAIRASGRLMQHFAKLAMLTDGQLRDRVVENILLEQVQVQRELDKRPWGPVNPVQVLVDDRVLPNGQPGIYWWQHGLGCLGIWESSLALQKLGDARHQGLFDLALGIGRDTVEFGMVQNSTNNEWLVVLSGKWFPQGASGGPTYYTYPRAGAWPHEQGTDYDMATATGSWQDWFSGAYGVVAASSGTDEIAERARAMIQLYGSGTGSLTRQKWFAF